MIKLVSKNGGEIFLSANNILYVTVEKDSMGYIDSLHIQVSKGDYYAGFEFKTQLAEINYKILMEETKNDRL